MDTLVIDTDVWSFWFKGDTRGAPYRALATDKTLFISFQTVAELYYWAEKQHWGIRRRRQLIRQLRFYGILEYDDATAHHWAQLRAECHQQGLPISAQDAWIAASALRHSCPLLTHNAADYAGISNLKIISLE